MNIGKTLQEARIKKGFTQTHVAMAMGYSTPQFISLIERGKSNIPPNKIKKICKLLGLNPFRIALTIVDNFENEMLEAIK